MHEKKKKTEKEEKKIRQTENRREVWEYCERPIRELEKKGKYKKNWNQRARRTDVKIHERKKRKEKKDQLENKDCLTKVWMTEYETGNIIEGSANTKKIKVN